ncbi:MAG TPA: hypothetical protein VIU64_15215 [Polyangia bacterium]
MPTTINPQRPLRLFVLGSVLGSALLVSLAPSVAVAADTAAEAQPPGPAPQSAPPPLPPAMPPAPSAQPMETHAQAPSAGAPIAAPMAPAPSVPGTPPPAGQWTYTQQYGWLWMPYDQRYTYVVDSASLAYEYVWYPTFGWSWVVAPWVLGLGVTPFWGVGGPVRFAWYSHPWFRVGTAHLRPTWGRGLAPRGGFGRGFGGGHGRR